MIAHAKVSGRRRTAGFTLIEVFIVMSIIVIIIVLMLPMVRRAMRMTGEVRCQNNMRQLIFAVEQYAAASRGFFPNLWPGMEYQDSLVHWLGYTNSYDVTKGQLYRYVRNKKAFWCPMDERIFVDPPVPPSFAFNAGVRSTPPDEGWALTNYKSAVMFLMLEEHPEESRFDGFVYLGGYHAGNDVISEVHDGSGHIGFLDGHVELMTLEEWEGLTARRASLLFTSFPP